MLHALFYKINEIENNNVHYTSQNILIVTCHLFCVPLFLDTALKLGQGQKGKKASVDHSTD